MQRFPLTRVLIGVLWLLVIPLQRVSKASSWGQVRSTLDQHAPSINTCLRGVREATVRALQNNNIASATPSLQGTHPCLSPLLKETVEGATTTIAFKNTHFSNELTIAGRASVELSALLESDFLEKRDLEGRQIYSNSICQNSRLRRFSYNVPPALKQTIEVRYALSIIGKYADTAINSNNEISGLMLELETIILLAELIENLPNQASMVMRALEVSYPSENLLETGVEANRNPSFIRNFITTFKQSRSTSWTINTPFLMATDSSPQLDMECGVQHTTLFITNGIAELTTRRRNYSSSGSVLETGFSINEQSIFSGDYRLRILTSQLSNGLIESRYRGVPLSVMAEEVQL